MIHLNRNKQENKKITSALGETLLNEDNVYIIGSETIFEKNTPRTQGTGDSLFLLFNAIADVYGIPVDNRPMNEHDWHMLLYDKGLSRNVCPNAWHSLFDPQSSAYIEGLEGYISKDLLEFLKNGIENRIIHTIFTTSIDEVLEAILRDLSEQNGLSFQTYNFKDSSNIHRFVTREVKHQITLVYLFGKIGDSMEGLGRKQIDYVYTEDDAMLTIAEYIKNTSDNIGALIRNIFFNKRIMAIGCRFDDWKFRFFWYSIRGNISSLGNGTVAYSCDNPQTDSLYAYLQRTSGLHVETDSRIFLKQMANVITSEQLFQKIREKRKQGLHGIFISYPSEDVLSAADLFYFFVEEWHFPVWMDCSNLKPQDKYRKEIEKAIEQCDIFMPLLTTQTKEDLTSNPQIEGRYYMKEWDYAKQCDKVIFPVTIGNYNFKDEYHKTFIEKCGFTEDTDVHISSIAHKEDIAKVVNDILKQKLLQL